MFDNLFDINNNICDIQGLIFGLKALYIYNYYKNNEKNVLVVTNSLYEANKYYQEISSYTNNVMLFPMDDFLTSEALAISPELKNTRLETMNNSLSNKVIVITNLMGYLRYLPSKNLYKSNILKLEKNSIIEKEKLISKLIEIGYTSETLVDMTGTYAKRGYVVDIFPISALNPIRIEFFDNEIEKIKEFDIDTQLTIKEINEVTIYPNTEFLIGDNDIKNNDISQKNLKKYIKPSNIYEFLDNPMVFFNNQDEIIQNYKNLLEEILEYNISINSNEQYMNSYEAIKVQNYKNFVSFDNKLNEKTEKYESYDNLTFNGNIVKTKQILLEYLKNKKTIIICFSDKYKLNKFAKEISELNIVYTNENNIFNEKINLIVKKVNTGFHYLNKVVISENELYNNVSNQFKYKNHFKLGSKIKDIGKLNIGDYVVHYSHGIGRYIGIKTLIKNGFKKDYLELEYRDGDKLYIPVEKIDLITKYSNNDSQIPKINKLGSNEWSRTKIRIKKKIELIAADLLKLYAKREASVGISFGLDTEEQIEFEKDFKYTETEDQLRITEEIKRDMQSNKPMDRLICGDVGYGKTELAFRAAFKAIMSGYQVALLCPTTILSNQHYQNALERFSSFAVNIKLLNRFTTSSQSKKIINDLKEGKIDLLIGTHRILSNDIKFKKLGLIIIDEEQRFGVKHKEKFKEYKNNIDVLTLSATPIPRTLQMSMSGIRSLSLLETPPLDRYPVQTYVLSENNQIIKDAIYKELSRNGQVFILYNRVELMEQKLSEIKKLVPDARIVCAHGKMDKNTLENIMISFINGEYDILLCTTIIETGIDIPNANTLIIMDADRFGLSQLYQIRGRVGRSNKIAYCYLMYDKRKTLTDVATKRLNVIKEFTELGSGFSIAVRDLSIRGAGDILGSEQAGFIDSVGVELFINMLNEEIKRQKGEKIEDKDETSLPLIDVCTSIDDEYVSQIPLKIEIHKMINKISNEKSFEEVKKVLEDRFGKLNEDMIIYMNEELFENKAKSLGITKVKQTKNFIEIVLPPLLTQKIDGQNLFMRAADISRMFRFSMKNRSLSIILDTVKLEKNYIYYLIDLCKAIKESIKSE